MAGNVWECVADWYDSDYYATSPLSNPIGPESGTERVKRGGSWAFGDGYDLRTARRGHVGPWVGGNGKGIRCAKN